MRKKYIVRLTSDERVETLAVVGKLKGTSRNVRRAQILFKADADGPDWTDAEIGEAFSCRTRTVERLRQRLCEQGFEAALDAEADDFAKVVDQYEITCTPAKFNGLQDALLKAKYEFVEAELKCIPRLRRTWTWNSANASSGSWTGSKKTKTCRTCTPTRTSRPR